MTVIDVGADHGYLSMSLSDLGKKVYAVENKIGPFENLKMNLAHYPGINVTPLLSDGLSYLPMDVKEAFILGMGGKTIQKILLESKDKISQIEHFVLEPQSDFSLVTKTMNELGYKNTKSHYIYERKYYPILCFEKGKEELDELEIEFSKAAIRDKDPILKKYLQEKISLFSFLSLNENEKEDKMRVYKETLKRWN